MIQEILKLPDFESNFEIESQKEKFRQFDKDLPDFLQDRSKLSKTGVIEIIKTKSYSRRDELLSILFWGLYFKVLARNPNSIRALMEFMSKDDFKSEMDRRVDLILESKNPSELFDSFTKNEKIPGLGYAYFTKLFFFYREALQPNGQTFPILDKWLGIAWCAISSTDNNNDSVYKNYYKPASSNVLEGALQRRKPEAYHQYVKFMNDLSQRENIQVKNLEEKLFGADLKKHPENNARHFYKNWAISKNIPLKKSEKKTER